MNRIQLDTKPVEMPPGALVVYSQEAETEFNQAITDSVKSALEKKGWKYPELSKVSLLHYQVVKNLMSGRTCWTVFHLYAVAKALRTTPNKLTPFKDFNP